MPSWAGSEAAPIGLRGTRSQGAVTSWFKGQQRVGLRVGEEGRLERVDVGGTQVRPWPQDLTETQRLDPSVQSLPSARLSQGGPGAAAAYSDFL